MASAPRVRLGPEDPADPEVQGLERLEGIHAPITASASISTSISGEMSRRTSTIAVAGRISRNTSPCTRAIGSHR